jgi:hypothetical protein
MALNGHVRLESAFEGKAEVGFWGRQVRNGPRLRARIATQHFLGLHAMAIKT